MEKAMDIKHVFTARKVEMTDGSELYEVVTPLGERVASATSERLVEEVEMALNMALTDLCEQHSDIEANED
jgi:hypothetical protein